MFRKLRLKFIGISTLSMLIVLMIVLGLVNLITYKNAVDDVFNTLEIIAKRGNIELKKGEIQAFKDKEITIETQYEVRYVTVNVSTEGEVIQFDVEHIAAINESDIADFIHHAYKSSRNKGIFEYNFLTYAFYKTKESDGSYKIIVMDCTRNLAYVRYFVNFSFYVGALSILLLMFLLSVFARKAVQPYVKNIEAQKRFITNASHELKTPLAVISANTEVIEMTCGKSEWTESTVNQVKRMSDLISQLVVLSKLEEREDIVFTDVNISEETKSVVSSLKTVAETQGKSLEYNVQEDVHVSADKNGIHELINILLDNAVKYCDDEGSIILDLRQKGRNTVLTVSNDYREGEGVDYSKFFDRFYRADESHNNKKEGFGIGLSMAESLVRMFKGKINVSYKKPRIIFTVVL